MRLYRGLDLSKPLIALFIHPQTCPTALDKRSQMSGNEFVRESSSSLLDHQKKKNIHKGSFNRLSPNILPGNLLSSPTASRYPLMLSGPFLGWTRQLPSFWRWQAGGTNLGSIQLEPLLAIVLLLIPRPARTSIGGGGRITRHPPLLPCQPRVNLDGHRNIPGLVRLQRHAAPLHSGRRHPRRCARRVRVRSQRRPGPKVILRPKPPAP